MDVKLFLLFLSGLDESAAGWRRSAPVGVSLRALPAEAPGAPHRAGTGAARTGVHRSDHPATALSEGVGARPVGSSLELVR